MITIRPKILLTLTGATLLISSARLIGAPIPEDCQIGGFAIGCQAYTFTRFTLFEAIEKTAAAGAKIIELPVGQKLSQEEPGVLFDHNASDEVLDKLRAKLAEHHLRPVNYGV